jgi:hypothetical protein
MKKLVVSFVFAFVAISAVAQSLSLSNENGAVPNNSFVYVSGDVLITELSVGFTFTNNGSTNIDVCVKKTEIDVISGTSNVFAFAGLLFPPMVYESPVQISLNSGESSSEFEGYYQPNGNLGVSTIRYTFFDYDNVNDSVCVNVQYIITDENPEITGVNPAMANIPESLTVEISGNNTNFAMGSGTTVWFTMASSTIFPYAVDELNNTLLEAHFQFTNQHDPGVYDVHTNNFYDGHLVMDNAFTLNPNPNPPYLVEIVPNEGSIPENLTVSVSGMNTHFTQGTGTLLVLQQGSSTIYPVSVDALNDNQLIGEFQFSNYHDPGYYDVKTFNTWDGDLYLYGSFYLNENLYPPQLLAIEPDSAETGDDLEVSISGQYTNFAQGTGTTVWLNMAGSSLYPYATTVLNDELINASFSIPNNTTTGAYDVKTHNYIDGNLILVDGFTIYNLLPNIVGINPTSAYVGEEVSLSIYGDNTHFNDASNCDAWLMKGNQEIYPANLDVVSNNEMIAEINIPEDAEAGNWTVFATNSIDGDMYLQNAFEIIDTVIQVHEYDYFKLLNVYPNPTSGNLFISYELEKRDHISVELSDLYGRILHKESFNQKALKHQEIYVPSLSSGVYYLKITSNSTSVSNKIIVK